MPELDVRGAFPFGKRDGLVNQPRADDRIVRILRPGALSASAIAGKGFDVLE